MLNPILKICVYYQNNLGQTFESTFEGQIIVPRQKWDEKSCKFINNEQPVIHESIFNSKPIPREIIENERNNNVKSLDEKYIRIDTPRCSEDSLMLAV